MAGDQTLYPFDEHDRATWREMSAWYRRVAPMIRRLSSWQEPPPQLGPEVYIALVPDGGIAGRTDEPGTGTDESIADIHFTECNLYYVDRRSDTDIEIQPKRLTKDVYNLGVGDIPAGSIVLAVRDKWGRFIAVEVAGGVDDDCIWIQLIEEGLGIDGKQGYYGFREMTEDGAGGFTVKGGGIEGTVELGAARCSSLKEAVPLGIVVKACRGRDFSGTDAFGTPIWWFTTPDLDQDILCLASVIAGETGTSGSNTCITASGTTVQLPDEWAEAVVTKYNPQQDAWHRKGFCWLKHINNLALTNGIRYRGHLCGFNVCGDPVYTTSDCCAAAVPGSDGDTIEATGTGTDFHRPERPDTFTDDDEFQGELTSECCGCAAMPANWSLVVAGVTNNTCSECNSYNGTFTLAFFGTDNSGFGVECIWHAGAINVCNPGGPENYIWHLQCYREFGYFELSPVMLGSPGSTQAPVYRKSIASWNCLGANTLTLVTYDDTNCANWPATLTVTPV